MLISLLVVLIMSLIIFMIFKESVHIFKKVSFFTFISNSNWEPFSTPLNIGIKNMILGTLFVSIIACLISLPFSLGASLFISLYLKDKKKEITIYIINMMAGIPSIIYGFLGFYLIVGFFEKKLNFSSGESILVAGITLSIMILPYMISTIVESLEKNISKYYIHSKSLVDNDIYIIWNLLIPSSKYGIITAVFLGLSRALGETMAVMMVIGNSNLLPKLFGKGITLSGLIAMEMGSAGLNSSHYHGLYAAGFVLILILLIVNLIYSLIKKVVDFDE